MSFSNTNAVTHTECVNLANSAIVSQLGQVDVSIDNGSEQGGNAPLRVHSQTGPKTLRG